ncbi:MAG TPA: hypothetical protein PLL64_10465 [Rhodothermales bacterium]|nr:hypothetical protein [Bacteroidota bacterium]HRK74690.1 hypothetical protein [Rhodothermales bacterium]HRR08191.1 hypothetical protein [Rhodothermales bacterium]
MQKTILADLVSLALDATEQTLCTGGTERKALTRRPLPKTRRPRLPITTMMVGEEETATTLAIGEEGDPPKDATMMVGEEL